MERSIETVEEAASKIRSEMEPRAPDTPWREIVGMRNVLAYVYWDVDTDIVWEVETVHLPVFAERIAHLRDSI